jgi:hypothetical protein
MRQQLKVNLATSVPPKIVRRLPNGLDIGYSYQNRCIHSWGQAGFAVTSLNPSGETEQIASLYPDLALAAVEKDAKSMFGRPLIWMSDIMDFLDSADSEIVGIVNSDVLLDFNDQQIVSTLDVAKDHLVAFNRTEVVHPGQTAGPLYRYGYDLYLFPRRFIQCFRMRGFALGAPWWDYWLLLNALLENLPLMVVQSQSAKHLTHPNNWNIKSWETTAQCVAENFRYYRHRSDQHTHNTSQAGFSTLANSITDLFVGSLRFDEKSNFLGQSINHGIGTLLGLSAVRTIEDHAFRLEIS